MLNWIIDFSLRTSAARRAGGRWRSAIAGVVVAAQSRHRRLSPTPRRCRCRSTPSPPPSGPEEIEQQITVPDRAGASAACRGSKQLRSISKFGLSQVVVTFEDGTDIYFARQLVNERLGDRRAAAAASSGRRWARSPPAWARCFTTSSPAQGNDVTELRTIHDWVIKPKLRTVHGRRRDQQLGRLREAVPGPHRSRTGSIKYEPDVRRGRRGRREEQPQRRRRQHPPKAARCCSCTAWAARRTSTDQEHRHHRQGRRADPRRATWPRSQIGHEIRRGAVTADGKGEVVLGLGFMLMGENSHEVTWALKDKLDEIKADAAAERQGRSRSTTAPSWSTTSSTRCARTCSRAACSSSPCCSRSWATCGRR